MITDDKRALELANLLLREGSLRRNDPEHIGIYSELMENGPLYEEVEKRLGSVGYELVQLMGHLGVRIASNAVDGEQMRNRMQLHAGHIRLIVYLWVHLVYREWINLRRDLDLASKGDEQKSLFADESEGEPPSMSFKVLLDELGENLSRRSIKGALTGLQRWRFVRYDEKRDRIWADAGLYIYVDRNRMEDFVISLARRVGTEDPIEAVSRIAAGSRIPNHQEPTEEDS